MSGNPFRRPTDVAPVLPSPQPSALHINTGTDRRDSKVKRVRIKTPPPLSPDSVYEPEPVSSPNIQRTTSSYFPPQPASNISLRPAQDFSEGSALQSYQGVQEGEADSSSDGDSDEEDFKIARLAPPTPIYKNKGFVNPFERTLATIEGTYTVQPWENKPNDSAARPLARSGMDVDSFKRLLMSGASTPVTPDASTLARSSDTALMVGDAEFNESFRALSRHASRTLDDTLGRAEMSSEAESVAATGAGSSAAYNDGPKRRTAPPPPVPRRGKPMAPRTPQVVGFADFDNFDAQATAEQTPKNLPPVLFQRSPSDTTQIPSQQLDESPLPNLLPRRVSEGRDSDLTSRLTDTLAPPPPPTRLSRSRGESNASTTSSTSEAVTTPAMLNHISTASVAGAPRAKVPPPPPSRRLKPSAPPSSYVEPQIPLALPSPTPPIMFPESPQYERDGAAFTATSLQVPGNRRPSATLSTSSRSSSISLPQTRGSMPPPPPPRARGASKSSFDLAAQTSAGASDRKLSATSDTARRLSQNESQYSAVTGDRNDQISRAVQGVLMADEQMETARKRSESMLSDLDALQREVDALQEQYRRPS